MPSSDQGNFGRWLEAARILSEDPDQKVPCPVCQAEFLQVRDLTTQVDEGAYVERILSCPSCGAWNSILRDVPRR